MSAITGTLQLVAGNGTATFSGDGGDAKQAGLNTPQKALPDNKGNLYIADTRNMRIRKVTADGIISTLAGIGTEGWQGPDGALATSVGIGRVQDLVLNQATNQLYFSTWCLAFRLDLETNQLYLVAGALPLGTAGCAEYGGNTGVSYGEGATAVGSYIMVPNGLVLDPAGTRLYIAERHVSNGQKARVSVVDLVTGTISTFVDDAAKRWPASTTGIGDNGLATSATLFTPRGLAFDKQGRLLICDEIQNRLRRVNTTGIITTIAGTAYDR
jgi:sugar lactone lactonase YvrE